MPPSPRSQFKIRKEALIGLGQLYRRCYEGQSGGDVNSIPWVRNKILHAYYQTAVDDRSVSHFFSSSPWHPCSSFVSARLGKAAP